MESEEIASSEVDMIVAMMSASSGVVFDIGITQSGDRGLGGSGGGLVIDRCSNQTATTCCAAKSEVPELMRPWTIEVFVVSISPSIFDFPLTGSLNSLCSVSNADTVLVQ